ncbi:hypothetical protein PUNSTDRAFT_52720, partial [Punctularia strigosozonata HHB-11173 SS5]|uniref:uncharacterized protein n=1 Tax=Punctularia strigosozonata (strain HHB-11173) TaxID=741275 RepID=UPI0004417631
MTSTSTVNARRYGHRRSREPRRKLEEGRRGGWRGPARKSYTKAIESPVLHARQSLEKTEIPPRLTGPEFRRPRARQFVMFRCERSLLFSWALSRFPSSSYSSLTPRREMMYQTMASGERARRGETRSVEKLDRRGWCCVYHRRADSWGQGSM